MYRILTLFIISILISCETNNGINEINFSYNSSNTGESFLLSTDNDLYISWIEESMDTSYLYMSKLNLDIWGKRELITKGVNWFVNWADFPSISINNKSDLMIAHYLKKSSEELNLKNLSMGMSADYQDAILHGSTYIRIGTAIFGKRNVN